jgi:Tol biopolymer transport system component
MMDANGDNLKQLTTGADDKVEVSVTQDGRYILYQSQGKIWRVNLDGSEPRQLTHGALDVHPCSSADGRSVVYASFPDWSPVIGGEPTLWRVSIDGGEPVQLTKQPASLPRVSPDGKLIACLYYSRADPRFSSFKIAAIPFDRGQPTKLFDMGPSVEDYVSWEPDGKALDYVETVDGVGNLWRQPLSGGPPEQLTTFESDRLFEFAWSRKKQVVFARGDVSSDIVLISSFN